jgi:hypothetical protein
VIAVSVSTYVDDAESLLDGDLLVEGEAGVNLSGDLAGDDLQDLATELDEQVVEDDVDHLVGLLARAVLLAVGDSIVDELGVLGLLGGGEDEGRVGGGILRLVLANGGEVTGVAHDGLPRRELSVFVLVVKGSDDSAVMIARVNSSIGTYGAGVLELVERGRHDCAYSCACEWVYVRMYRVVDEGNAREECDVTVREGVGQKFWGGICAGGAKRMLRI